MTPTITKHNDVTLVLFGADCWRIAIDDVTDLDTLLEATETADPPLVVVDLSHTVVVSSSFLSFLVRIWRRLKLHQEGRFALSGLTPHCAEMLRIVRLDDLWEIYESKEEAVHELSNSTVGKPC